MPGFSSSFFYESLRRAFALGLRVKPILEALDYREPSVSVLDLGCGFGNLAPYFKSCDYTGVDLDPERIAWAKVHMGENSCRKFLCGDVTGMNFPDKSFDKAVAYGILHHLSDDEAAQFFAHLKRLVRGRVVFSDPVYVRFHPVNNLLCRMDLGKYVRSKEEYLALYKKHLNVTAQRTFWARNGLSCYLLVTCSAS